MTAAEGMQNYTIREFCRELKALSMWLRLDLGSRGSGEEGGRRQSTLNKKNMNKTHRDH